MSIQFKKRASKEILPVYYGQGMRTPPKLRWILLMLLLSIPLLVLLYQVFNEYVLIRFPGLITFNTITIRAPDIGYVEKLDIQVGEKIKKNQILLQFSSPETNIKLDYLLKEKKRITELMKALGDQTPHHLKNLLDVAKRDIVSSKVVYERFKNYAKKGDMIELQLEGARKNYISAQSNYASLEQKIKEAQLQSKTLMEVNYGRKLREIDNDIDKINSKIKHFRMRSSQPGAVMSLQTHPGEYVSAGQSLMTLITDNGLRVVAFIDPKYAEDAHKNKKVSIQLPNKVSISGHIINTPSYAEKIPLSQTHPLAARENKLIAVIELDETVPELYQVFGIPVLIKFD